MLLTVLRYGLVVITILAVDVYSSCLYPKTCPCGKSGKNYTRCHHTVIEQYSCERWANCQTCDSSNELCATCPPGRTGPTCKDGSCPFLKRPKNGVIQCSYDSTSLRSCTAHCFPGYRFENYRNTEKVTLNCEGNVWKPRQDIPNCRRNGQDCHLRGTGSHSYNCTIGMHGSYCDIKCNGIHQGTYHCYPGRGWNTTLPSCITAREPQLFQWKKTKAICPDPGTPVGGGRVDLKGNSIPSQLIFREGDTVLYFCKGRGTSFEKITYLTCKSDATWYGMLPQCVHSQKGAEPMVVSKAFGGRRLFNESHKAEVKVQAESSCKHPGVVENGIIQDFESDTEQFPVGTELKFLCREGYKIQGPEAIYCLLNLSWSEAPPVCNSPTASTELPPNSQLFCQHPGTVENGFIVDDVPDIQSFPLGSELKFQCNEGHELVGANAIYCLHSFNQRGYWSDVLPICRYVATTTPQAIPEIHCKHPGAVENGMTENYPPETERFPVGVLLKFKCKEGYELVGATRLFCKRNGEWTIGIPKCKFIPKILVPEISCTHPGMVENGRYDADFTKTSFPVGTALKVHCNPGTQLEGPATIFCLPNGQWSLAPPSCKSILQERIEETKTSAQLQCRYPGTVANGYSASRVQVYRVGSKIEFKCREGFSLVGPDTIRCLETGLWTSALPACRPIPDCGRVFQDVYRQTGKFTRSDWPWTVGISTVCEDNIEEMFCTGALLNSRTVLTAAHCATTHRNINLHFGHRRLSANGVIVPEQVRAIQISGVFIHPEYDEETHANDVALMKFEPHIYYNNRTQTVCLPTPILQSSGENLFPGTKSIVTGYGLQFAANYSSTAKFLMLELPIQSERACEEICRGQGLNSCNPSTFCAGYSMISNECVYGGSPLVVFHPEKNRYTLEGLVTRAESTRNRWNGRCKLPESYTRFTNVTHYMPFIMKHL